MEIIQSVFSDNIRINTETNNRKKIARKPPSPEIPKKVEIKHHTSI